MTLTTILTIIVVVFVGLKVHDVIREKSDNHPGVILSTIMGIAMTGSLLSLGMNALVGLFF